jgi:hypothetical protein
MEKTKNERKQKEKNQKSRKVRYVGKIHEIGNYFTCFMLTNVNLEY